MAVRIEQRRKTMRTPGACCPSMWSSIGIGLIALAALLSGCSTAAVSGGKAAGEPMRVRPTYVNKQQLHAPYAIALGPQGDIWFSEYQNNALGRFTTTGEVVRFTLGGDGFPERLTAGPDGDIWFTDPAANRIGRLKPADGSVDYFPIPTPKSGPVGITTGPDGAVWFSEHAVGQIGRIAMDGKIIEYTVPAGGGPGEIVAGHDNNLWFVEDYGNNIGRITVHGVVTEFPIPTPQSRPGGLAIARDGTPWFTELAANKVGKVGADDKVVDFALPLDGVPLGIACGPDGNIWITSGRTHIFYEVSANGSIRSLRASPDIYPGFMVAGPDHSLWFTEPSGKIGRLTPPASITEFALPEPGQESAPAVQTSAAARGDFCQA